MIYQVKIDQAVLFTGDTAQVLLFLADYDRYPLEWLVVYSYAYGTPERRWPPHSEKASDFVK